ncbi:hypothetical protein [Streptomyces pinistramenti]|uniref:hypothetical protein n=1 Tax=Streptomyces pinistramenti TaxID=2884812 RepID=UPI0035577B5F
MGAILTFAVDRHMAGAALDLGGLILVIVGIIGSAAHMSVLNRRRTQPPPAGGPRVRR